MQEAYIVLKEEMQAFFLLLKGFFLLAGDRNPIEMCLLNQQQGAEVFSFIYCLLAIVLVN